MARTLSSDEVAAMFRRALEIQLMGMIGYSQFDWRELGEENAKPTDGLYYCGCAYIRGKDACEHHGDPVERWPSKETNANAND